MTRSVGDTLSAKIELHTPLGEAERAALASLLTRTHAIAAGETVASAGEPLDICTIVREGFLCRTKLLADGRKQILSFLAPGDVIDAHASVLRRRDDNLEAITAAKVAIVPQSRIAAVSKEHPALGEALLREAFIEAAIVREWVLSLGRRNAVEALAHLICELHVRTGAVGLTVDGRQPFPFRQQHLADALGLSLIHLNRVLKQLRESGMVKLQSSWLTVTDWPALTAAAAFNPAYLHIENLVAA